MSAVPKKFRRVLTEEEFLERVATFNIDCRMSDPNGGMVWFHGDWTVGPRKGVPVTPQQVIEFLRAEVFEGEQCLRVFENVGYPGKLGLERTPAGRRRVRARAYWNSAVAPKPPRRFTHRRGAIRRAPPA